MLEGDHTLDHEALELATVPNVVRREVVVLLVHILNLRQDVRRDEPAAAELVPVDAHFRRDAEEVAARRVVPAAEVEVVTREAIQALANRLCPRAVTGG